MVECENEHVFCRDELLEEIDSVALQANGYYTTEDFCSASACPICQMKYIKDNAVLIYLLDKHQTNKTEVCQEIRTKFGNYSNLRDFVNEKNTD